jgi:hypothetical protein
MNGLHFDPRGDTARSKDLDEVVFGIVFGYEILRHYESPFVERQGVG